MTRGQLNAGHLGGRFLKRTIPQKVKPVPSHVTENDMVTAQNKQALPEVSRRSRTSAAMIGLAAISMGAHGLLVAHQGDEAIAAEPPSGEPAVAANPSAFDVAAVSSGDGVADSTQALGVKSGSLIEHTVQEGETLWQLAQFYGADAVTVASLNGISLDTVLHVGQVLKIPTDNRVASALTPNAAEQSMPGYYGLIEGLKVDSSASALAQRDSVLKEQQDTALESLKEKQNELRTSLAKSKVLTASSSSVSGKSAATAPLVEEQSTTHRVAPGDTLSAIARSYGISQRRLAKANGITNPDVIRVNQVLVIPQDAANAVSKPANSPEKAAEVPNLIAMAAPSPAVGVPVITSDTSSSTPLISHVGTQLPQPVQNNFQPRIASVPPEVASESAQSAEKAAEATTEQDAKVAVSPFVNNQSSGVDNSTATSRYSYVENLRLEIVKLREKYQNSAQARTTPSETKVAAVSLKAVGGSEALPERVNPEFNPSGYTESVRSQVRKLQAKAAVNREASSLGSPRSVAASNNQLVATAPIGSENYEPLLPSSLGKMVSPDLPPLGSVDSYLPGATGKFNGYIWPAKGLLTSGYGWRWGRMHKGIDIAAPIGTPVVAAASGVVITAGWNSGGYGNMVEIQHPDGSVTLYAHNNRLLVREGQQVEQGQQIAEMGSTGYSTGPHSHFEVHLPGHGAVNPMAYLPRGGA